jgi:hypothetical protein
MVVWVALLWRARRMAGREDEVDDLLVGMIGVAVGVASTIPLARYLGKAVEGDIRQDFQGGFARAILPFVAIQAALLVVFLMRPSEVPTFGLCSVGSYLASVLAEGLTAWRRMG